MSSAVSGKRKGDKSGELRKKKRQRYKQHSSTTHRRDLGNGTRGFLISCTPKHEVQCFRDALILLHQHIDVDGLTAEWPPTSGGHVAAQMSEGNTNQPVVDQPKPEVELAETRKVGTVTPIGAATESIGSIKANTNASVNATVAEHSEGPTKAPVTKQTTVADVSESLKAELNSLKHPDKSIFTRVDLNVSGSIFVRIDDRRIDLEAVAEGILEKAKASQSPGCRFCIKIIPVHSTCYAKAEDAAVAAVGVVAHAFPAGEASYAIQFKSRMNTGAHRDDYIKAIADAIDKEFPKRFSVNLTKPDVVLLVEVMKTSCCIGTFRKYFELGKMNVREVCKSKNVPVISKGSPSRNVKDVATSSKEVESSGALKGSDTGSSVVKSVIAAETERDTPTGRDAKPSDASIVVDVKPAE